MIRYTLICHDCETEFEAWYANSQAYDRLSDAGEVSCVACGGTHVGKAIMAPAVRASRDKSTPDPQQVFGQLAAAARQHGADNFDSVGDGFASEAKAMHYGDIPHKPIWGETTPEEREALREEGVPAAPLHPAFVPPKPVSDKKLN